MPDIAIPEIPVDEDERQLKGEEILYHERENERDSKRGKRHPMTADEAW